LRIFLWIGLSLVLFCCFGLPRQARSQTNLGNSLASKTTKIVLLGTGTPNADPERSGPAVAIVVNDTPYLVDFGPGVVRRAAAAEKLGVKGLAPKNLRVAFVTHLHSDHTAGYPDLILTPWVLDRDKPLEVYGPPGLASMTEHILKAYKEDIDVRLKSGEPISKEGYKVIAHEIGLGVIYKDQNVTVTAFPVHHGTWKYAFGYRFDTPDKRIVISGDCTPSEEVIKNCDGCDALVHEVYSGVALAKRPIEWQRYHSNFHTSAEQLAELAAKARPKVLILYHQLMWTATESELLAEIRNGYKGTVISGHDLDIY